MLSKMRRRDLTAVAAGTVGGWLIGTAGSWGALLVAVVGILVWVLRPPSVRGTVMAVALLVMAAGLAGAVASTQPLEGAVVTAVNALLVAAGVAVCAGVVAALRQRAAHRRLGWELARAVEDRERARVEEAVTAERAVMAGEIHDRLGHHLTLIAVQLGRLSLDEDLPAPTREAVERIRSEAADAAAELGETVTLLKAGHAAEIEPATRTLTQVVEGAQDLLDVDVDIPEGLEERLGPHAHAALERALTEALTNAAKHAPGQAVTINASLEDDVAQLTVRNPRTAPRTRLPSPGHGLASLRTRLEILGGQLDAGGAGDFVLRARVPLDAHPVAVAEPTPIDVAERDFGTQSKRISRLAWLVPAALAVPAAVFAVGYFAYATVASVLPPETFAQLQIGMDQPSAERILPAVQMLDAPREQLPEPPGATCRYFESALSPFEREDSYRVCFTDGMVSDLSTIPAP